MQCVVFHIDKVFDKELETVPCNNSEDQVCNDEEESVWLTCDEKDLLWIDDVEEERKTRLKISETINLAVQSYV